MKKFTASSQHVAFVPFTVTKASDIIVAICNREDTANIIGVKEHGPNRDGYTIPVTHSVMVRILGAEIATAFPMAMGNPALREYFDRVCDRLHAVSINIAWSKKYWYINKLPSDKNNEKTDSYAYGLQDLVNQGPAGFVLENHNGEDYKQTYKEKFDA